MFPHVDDLPQETSMWLAWSGQDTVMSHHIWYTIDWLGTQQYKWPVSISRSRVLLSLLTFPQASPEPSHHRGGWAWLSLFFWHQIHGFSTNHPIPSTQQASHCPLTSDIISVESGPMPQVEVSGMPWPQMPDLRSGHWVFSSYHASDQVTETRNFHDSTSMLKKSIEPATKLRKTQSLFSD